ncbi:MAG: arginase family protein [Bacillota bacterium]
MHPDTLTEMVQTALQHPKVTPMDIVEIDPTLDIRDMTSRVAAHLVIETLIQRALANAKAFLTYF